MASAALASSKSGTVVDWYWMNEELPIAADPFSKRARNLLFQKLDADANGMMHMREVTKGFLKTVRVVRGILDLRPVWTSCFRLTRAAIDPVIPIGIDFMEKNQFRMYLVSVWLYLRLWEHFYFSCPKGHVTVQAEDLPEVVKILESFGYPDAQRFDAFVRPQFWDAASEIPFHTFAEVCLKHVLPELGEIDGEAEKATAIYQLSKFHPGLLHKGSELGAYKAHSIETGQPRMTGFNFRQMRKSASESALLRSPEQIQSTGNAGPVGPKDWSTQYAMQYTTTKFLPKARRDPYKHPSQTDRTNLPMSHPYNQALRASLSPTASACSVPLHSDVSRLVYTSKRTEAGKPLQTAGATMAQKLQRLGVIQDRS